MLAYLFKQLDHSTNTELLACAQIYEKQTIDKEKVMNLNRCHEFTTLIAFTNRCRHHVGMCADSKQV